MNKELATNTTLSHYRIVSKIGEGGMGEVYRAHDARLDREVAIKVLPADFAADKDRLQRFEKRLTCLRSDSSWLQALRERQIARTTPKRPTEYLFNAASVWA
jgi:serine/threonine protein kinase